jgi:hypothetical protein
LAYRKAFQSLPDLIDFLGVDRGACAPLQSELINEIGQDGEVMTGLQSDTGFTPGQKTRHPAAVLRRAGSVPVQANGIDRPPISLMPALEAHLVLPRTIEVVLVAKTGSLAEAKLGECNIRRLGCQL